MELKKLDLSKALLNEISLKVKIVFQKHLILGGNLH